MLYKLVLGDWSDDGHGQTAEVLFECNYDVHKIRQAYKDSCKKLGIAFNSTEDYTGLGLKHDDNRVIWMDYEEKEISKLAFDTLGEANCFDGIDYEETDYGYEIYDNNDCAKLIMNFIALSMPNDFTYELVEVEEINGYWNDELNEQFGYGLFD